MTNFKNWQTGCGGMNKLTLTHNNARAEIYRYGAHLTFWHTGEKEQLFLSKQAQFAQGKAIRGGVPVIFPQFSGFGAGQRHGFARNMEWQLIKEPTQENGAATCTFALEANEKTLALWPHHFRIEFTPSLSGSQLSMNLTIHNTDTKPFTFSAALHTYFAVSDVQQVQLVGLQATQFWDNNGSDFKKHRFIQEQKTLMFPDAIDRVYFNCQQPLQLIDGSDRLQIQAQGFKEVVVWNPGAEATKQFNDMADEEYKNMLCIEAAVIDQPITLAPGERWSGAQLLTQL